MPVHKKYAALDASNNIEKSCFCDTNKASLENIGVLLKAKALIYWTWALNFMYMG